MEAPGPAALPLVNWLFWAALTTGTIGVVAATELLGGTTRGYRVFMAFVVTAFAVILVASEFALPGDRSAVVRRLLVLASAGACAAYLVASLARLPRTPAAVTAALLGVAASLAMTAQPVDERALPAVSLVFGAQIIAATLALGSATAGMLLGHWYLVTPRLSPVPLRRMMWLLLAALALQAAAFVAALVAVPSAEALTGSVGWLTWLRLLAGIGLPLVITALAMIASRAASLQATTGLLYVALALVMAGTIAGSSITFLTGVPV